MLSQFDATYYGYHQQPAQKVKVAIRQKVQEETGLNFLRFEDKEVRKDVKQVVSKIENYINEYSKNHIS